MSRQYVLKKVSIGDRDFEEIVGYIHDYETAMAIDGDEVWENSRHGYKIEIEEVSE